jgi:delta 1-pyrroline-5-carboxylate dehydrogenase
LAGIKAQALEDFSKMAEVVALKRDDAAKELKNYVGGAWVATGKLFDSVDPTTGRVTGVVHEAGRAEVDAAVAAAKAALKGPWGSMSQEARRTMLHAIADRIVERHADFLDFCRSIQQCPD